MSNVISMDERISKTGPRASAVRDRRYAIRYPFAADVVLLDLETGTRIEGVTSDLSLGGCFVCCSKSLPARTRARITLTRREQVVEALAVVRIVKPRVGLGIEFIDVTESCQTVLMRWLEQVRRSR